jgi:colicin import membrane protein
MTKELKRHEPALSGMLCGSLLLHVGLFVLVATFRLLPPPAVEEPVYYVDIVNLPVANPRPGTPAPATPEAAPAPAAEPSSLSLPPKSTDKTTPVPAQKPAKPGEDAAARELAERLARLERDREAREEAAALEALRKKLAAKSGAAGMPKAGGGEAGSDYGAYVQSRLKDALASTIVYQSKKPEAAVRLYIDKKGKLVRFVIEKSSRDKLFDDAVVRAITKAKANFPPPPGGSDFEKLFVFSPEEVGRR